MVCRIIDPSLATSPGPLAHRQNLADLSVSYRYYFSKWSSELAELVSLLIIAKGPLVILIGCMTFLSLLLDVVYVSIFFLCSTRLCNLLPAEYFPLTHDLNGFTSRVDRHFFMFEFFLTSCPICLSSSSSFFCNSMPCSVAFQIHFLLNFTGCWI